MQAEVVSTRVQKLPQLRPLADITWSSENVLFVPNCILRKDSRCQKESIHQHLICRNLSSYINCWLQSPVPTGQGLAYGKENFLISQSIPFYGSIWLSGWMLNLFTWPIEYWYIGSYWPVYCLLNKKMSLEKKRSWGESRYFDFHKYLWKASSSTRKRRGLLYHLFHS